MRSSRHTPRILSFAMLLLAAGIAVAEPPSPSGAPSPGSPGGDWPKTILLGQRKVILDTPHAESLEGTALEARGGIGLVRAGETEPAWGTIWYEADVTIDRDRRTVTLASVHVSRIQVAGLPSLQLQRLAGRLSLAIARRRITLGLDDVLASARIWQYRSEAPPKLGTEPPQILFETEPAVLVVFDGEPRFHPVGGSHLKRAMNTAFLVLSDPRDGSYYLDGGTLWFRASDPAGPWTKADDVPPEAVEIARRDREEAGVSEKEMAKTEKRADSRVPKILVATAPTELIVSDGPPKWTSLVEGELETLSSSDDDVFRTPDGKVWVVLSGRWYESDSLKGPWTFVPPDRLPDGFADIPADSPKAEVLAFVPGTSAAHEALEDEATPRTAAIRRKDAHVNVTYDGEPRFEKIPGTHVEYALNTASEVLRIRGRYYVCDQGVWFEAASPTGPWVLADSIPEEEIQTIPPDSPVYSTRFVTIYDSTPDLVYTAYTPAYLGSYPYYGTVVFGTGWWYRPWWGAFYYPRPWTWGFGALYRPWFGWGFGFAWRPAWFGFRWGFGFGWGAAWCGPAGFYRPAFAAASVSITRNVILTRNVYNSGANVSRATTQGVSSGTVSASRTAAGTSSRTPAARSGSTKSKGGRAPAKKGRSSDKKER